MNVKCITHDCSVIHSAVKATIRIKQDLNDEPTRWVEEVLAIHETLDQVCEVGEQLNRQNQPSGCVFVDIPESTQK